MPMRDEACVALLQTEPPLRISVPVCPLQLSQSAQAGEVWCGTTANPVPPQCTYLHERFVGVDSPLGAD
jgi:hypothetical protein